MRPCGVYPRLNDCIEKMAPNTPPLQHALEGFVSCPLWLEADGEEFFHQTALDRNSRDFCTLITPIGKSGRLA